MKKTLDHLRALLAPMLSQALAPLVEGMRGDIRKLAASGPLVAILGLCYSICMLALVGFIAWLCVGAGAAWALPAFALPLAIALLWGGFKS